MDLRVSGVLSGCRCFPCLPDFKGDRFHLRNKLLKHKGILTQCWWILCFLECIKLLIESEDIGTHMDWKLLESINNLTVYCIFLPIKAGFWEKWRNKSSNSRIKNSKFVFSSDYETSVVWRISKDILISWFMILAKNSFAKMLHFRTCKNIVPMSVLLVFLSYHCK